MRFEGQEECHVGNLLFAPGEDPADPAILPRTLRALAAQAERMIRERDLHPLTRRGEDQAGPLLEVTLTLCQLCLARAGSARRPGALWMNRAPDIPLFAAMPGSEEG
jgi:hypothetical protein